MAFVVNQDETVSVTAYSLHEFAFDLAYLGSKGFTPSLENNKCPWGGISGGMYNATLVKLTDYYIDLQGNHINAPKDDVDVAVESVEQVTTASVEQSSGVEQDVAETPPVVQTTKTTRTKKTTT